ncbi:putative General transcription and DNA repair factor IIH helicase subunit XPB [Blattamonas nauphoetae]|uniref:DNA 3'-5' helicase n=1 Tax=Blattamonas nauphoetae TaxID=2049346 RepID=A0ABQ9YMF0_9EUKA|nr:putative General transcription and DNA repair factor IIH helicase subunit XPB [Blattamonas nauphoetae]
MRRRKQKEDSEDDEEDEYESQDFQHLEMKEHNLSRPLWVLPNGHIFLEATSQFYRETTDFLIAIAEPVSRPRYIHEYKLTSQSMLSAVSIGRTFNDIMSALNLLSKNKIDEGLVRKIEEWTTRQGRLKLVLRENQYYLESPDQYLLHTLQQNPTIKEAVDRANLSLGEGENAIETVQVTTKAESLFQTLRSTIQQLSESFPNVPTTDPLHPYTDDVEIQREKAEYDAQASLIQQEQAQIDDDEFIIDEQIITFSVRIHQEYVDKVRQACETENHPALQEYDFIKDYTLPNLGIELRATSTLREHQEKALGKMFGGGRAHSGLIVLPCGAGKTLVGITAASTVKKGCIVVCNSNTSVEQWRHEFKVWSTIEDDRIISFTSKSKSNLPDSCVLITTYSILTFSQKRAQDSQLVIDQIKSRDWGLIVFDEVHALPANNFRRVNEVIRANCKLGLTATLVREDKLIKDLTFLIGPKLYEANWQDLQDKNFLARVQCVELLCPMSGEFYAKSLMERKRKQLLYSVLNPNKIQACEYLIRFHQARHDHILVFCDNIFSLKYYAGLFNTVPIYGGTPYNDRMAAINAFNQAEGTSTLFLSQIGDTSFDLPDANVLIQVSSHFGSRRQEAQRLGRILRPKQTGGEFNAFFYTLVSRDTSEMAFSAKRRSFLINQGYSYYSVDTFYNIPLIRSTPDIQSFAPQMHMQDPAERRKLLVMVISANEEEALEEKVGDEGSMQAERAERKTYITHGDGRREQIVPSSFQALGGGLMGRAKAAAPKRTHAPLFEQRNRQLKKERLLQADLRRQNK